MENTQEPVWDQLIDIDIGNHIIQPWDAPDVFLYFEAWDSDVIVDEKICHCVVPLRDVLEVRGMKYLRMFPVLARHSAGALNKEALKQAQKGKLGEARAAARKAKRDAEKKAKKAADREKKKAKRAMSPKFGLLRRGRSKSKKKLEGDEEGEEEEDEEGEEGEENQEEELAEETETKKDEGSSSGDDRSGDDSSSDDSNKGAKSKSTSSSESHEDVDADLESVSSSAGSSEGSTSSEEFDWDGWEDELESQPQKSKVFFTNVRLLRLRAKFGRVKLMGNQCMITCLVGHMLGFSALQLKSFVELRCVKGDPKRNLLSERPMSRARTLSRFCEDRACEWNERLEISLPLTKNKNVYVSMVVYRGGEAVSANALAQWSISLQKLLKMVGLKPMKVRPVFLVGQKKEKYNVHATTITVELLGTGIMDEPLPDYKKLNDEFALMGGALDELHVESYLDPAEYDPHELKPLQAQIFGAQHLPTPWNPRKRGRRVNGRGGDFTVPAALFVELSLLQDTGAGKLLLAPGLTTELNDNMKYPHEYHWAQEALTFKHIPFHDDTLEIGVRVMHFACKRDSGHVLQSVEDEHGQQEGQVSLTRFFPKSCANPISSTPTHLSM